MVVSCNDSPYEDLMKFLGVIKQAERSGLTLKTPLLVSLGSEKVRATVERDKNLETLESTGAVVLSNSCGLCAGQ
jgi:aconitase A